MGKDPSPPIPTRDLSPEEQTRVIGLLTRVQDRLLFNVEATDDDRRLTAYALRSAQQGALLRAWIGPLAALFERFPDPFEGDGAPRGKDEQQEGGEGVRGAQAVRR